MGGAFRPKWVGHLQLRWVGQLRQSEFLFLGRYAQKNTGFQGSTLSGHRMTTGFGTFELPTRGLLQKEWDHSPPKCCFVRSPAFWLATIAIGIHSAMNTRITKQIGGGVKGEVIVILTGD